LHGGFGLNAANSLALRELSRLSVLDAVLSFEMKFSEISRLSEAIPVGIIAYGKLPAMLAKNCPDKALYGCRNCPRKLFDKTKRSFDIVCNPDYVEILNSEMLFLADKLSEIPDVDFLQLKFYRESADEINRICRLYKNGAESAPPKMTRGLYYRGIR
jgi:putative protease